MARAAHMTLGALASVVLLGTCATFVPALLGEKQPGHRASTKNLRAQSPELIEPSLETATTSEPWSWVSSLLGFGVAVGLIAGFVMPDSARAITAEQFSQLTWYQVKGSGLANRCPTVESVGTEVPVKEGNRFVNVCFEPKSFAVETETVNGQEFVTTRLVTGQTYTIDYVTGDLSPNPITFQEKDGMDFQAVTVQLPNAERVPFLFSMKKLKAVGEGSSFKPGFTWGGEFEVPSYRTGGFLDPKGRGMYTGYDQAQALVGSIANGKEAEELFKETNKVFDIGKGAVEMEVNKVNQPLGEVGGVFVSKQPSDTDMGARAPKTVLLKGIFYGKVVDATWQPSGM
jgi:photosystem II oxygen-evolving enhancer protein 1